MPLKGYYHNELEKVDKGSKRLREVMDGLSPTFFVGMLTIEGVMTYTNRTSLEAIGLKLKDIIGRRFEDTPWWAYSEVYRQQLRDAITLAANGEASRFDLMCQSLDGRLLTLDFSLNPVLDAKKNVSYLVPSAHDVTERRTAERALKMLSMCNKALLHAQDEATLLHHICQLIVDVGGYRMAWVGFAENDDAKTIKAMAHAGNNQCYLSKVIISWDENFPSGNGPADKCIRNCVSVVCEDTRVDVATESWRKLLVEHGYTGLVALPLRNEQQTFGLLGLYSSNVPHITDGEISLLQEMADNLAYGLMSMRAQQDSLRVLSVVNKIADSVALSTGAEFLEKLVLNMTEAIGAQVGIITRLQSGELPYSRTVVVVVDGKIASNFDIPISGTPCESLSKDVPEWIVPSHVVAQYPRAEGLATLGAEAYVGRRIEDSMEQPMGQIFVLFRQPLVHGEFVSSVLKIFTARVAAELERQEKQVFIHEQASWLDQVHHVVIVRSLDHRILFWNKSAERLYGWSKAEVLGRSIAELVYADNTEFFAATQTVLSKGEWRGEISQRGKDGNLMLVDAHWSLVLDEIGQPKSIFCINSKITDRI